MSIKDHAGQSDNPNLLNPKLSQAANPQETLPQILCSTSTKQIYQLKEDDLKWPPSIFINPSYKPQPHKFYKLISKCALLNLLNK